MADESDPKKKSSDDNDRADQKDADEADRGSSGKREEKDEQNSKPPKVPLRERKGLIVGGIIVAVVLIVTGVAWWLHARQFEDTDDAFIDTHVVRLSPRTAGQILSVTVKDNDLVHAGDVLAEIDSADVQTQVSQLQAQKIQAEAALEQVRARIAVAEANQEQAHSNLVQATAQAERNARNAQRYRSLRDSTPEAVSKDQLDQSTTEERSSNAQRDAAAQQFKGAQAQVVAAHADEAQAQAKIAELKAQQDQANLTLGYTKIIAPLDGHVAQKSIAVGTYVAPGQQILAIVPLTVWITANMKETQLAHMRPGQSVSVDVDSCPDIELSGHVDSIQRGAGQAFGLLPPENATGNYVKVVQRVPVKIVLDTVPRDCVLGPGMSVVPTIRVR